MVFLGLGGKILKTSNGGHFQGGRADFNDI